MDKDVIMSDCAALAERVKDLEEALREIVDIADVSDGRAAAFFGMLARKALGGGDVEGIL
tara:strand:+ start:2324 stop:2503 length:180 start_codon:yes stop_codon:yes gene_type:complete